MINLGQGKQSVNHIQELQFQPYFYPNLKIDRHYSAHNRFNSYYSQGNKSLSKNSLYQNQSYNNKNSQQFVTKKLSPALEQVIHEKGATQYNDILLGRQSPQYQQNNQFYYSDRNEICSVKQFLYVFDRFLNTKRSEKVKKEKNQLKQKNSLINQYVQSRKSELIQQYQQQLNFKKKLSTSASNNPIISPINNNDNMTQKYFFKDGITQPNNHSSLNQQITLQQQTATQIMRPQSAVALQTQYTPGCKDNEKGQNTDSFFVQGQNSGTRPTIKTQISQTTQDDQVQKFNYNLNQFDEILNRSDSGQIIQGQNLQNNNGQQSLLQIPQTSFQTNPQNTMGLIQGGENHSTSFTMNHADKFIINNSYNNYKPGQLDKPPVMKIIDNVFSNSRKLTNFMEQAFKIQRSQVVLNNKNDSAKVINDVQIFGPEENFKENNLEENSKGEEQFLKDSQMKPYLRVKRPRKKNLVLNSQNPQVAIYNITKTINQDVYKIQRILKSRLVKKKQDNLQLKNSVCKTRAEVNKKFQIDKQFQIQKRFVEENKKVLNEIASKKEFNNSLIKNNSYLQKFH